MSSSTVGPPNVVPFRPRAITADAVGEAYDRLSDLVDACPIDGLSEGYRVTPDTAKSRQRIVALLGEVHELLQQCCAREEPRLATYIAAERKEQRSYGQVLK